VVFVRRRLPRLRPLFVLLLGFPLGYAGILLVMTLIAYAAWGPTRYAGCR